MYIVLYYMCACICLYQYLYLSIYLSSLIVLDLGRHLAKHKVESILHAEHHRKFQTDEKFKYNI